LRDHERSSHGRPFASSFFKRRPAPLAKLVFFVIVSLALLISDLNLRYLDAFRQGCRCSPIRCRWRPPRRRISCATPRLLRVAGAPADREQGAQAPAAAGAERLLRLDQLEQENRHLRALLEARERQPVKSVVAEIMPAKDPFSRKVILDKGAQAGIEAGRRWWTTGVIGQITRVFPMQSELTLLTDKDQAIPVMIVRSGLRAVLFGSGN
jgi:rod shape-determining protein MreC